MNTRFPEINAHEADASVVVGKQHSIYVKGYKPYLKCSRENEDRQRVVGIYVHKKLQRFIKEIEGNCEYVLWIEIKYISPTIVLLGVVYNPPKANLADFGRFADEVERKCSEYGNVILTGDFNSHTQTDKDFLQNDAFNDMVTIFEMLYIPLVRSNQDKTDKYSRGNKLIELCKQNNIRILNGRLFSDKGIGEPTYIRSYTDKEQKTVIDYVIATDRCLELFKSFKSKDVTTYVLFVTKHLFLNLVAIHCNASKICIILKSSTHLYSCLMKVLSINRMPSKLTFLLKRQLLFFLFTTSPVLEVVGRVVG